DRRLRRLDVLWENPEPATVELSRLFEGYNSHFASSFAELLPGDSVRGASLFDDGCRHRSVCQNVHEEGFPISAVLFDYLLDCVIDCLLNCVRVQRTGVQLPDRVFPRPVPILRRSVPSKWIKLAHAPHPSPVLLPCARSLGVCRSGSRRLCSPLQLNR